MTGTLLSITGARATEQIGVADQVTLEIDVLHETVTLEAEVRARRADGPNRVIYGVQFCDDQTQAVGRLALALANIWVEEAQAAPRAERSNGPRENGELVWRPEPRQQPQLTLAPVEIETAS